MSTITAGAAAGVAAACAADDVGLIGSRQEVDPPALLARLINVSRGAAPYGADDPTGPTIRRRPGG